jgi:hypothetical protein
MCLATVIILHVFNLSYNGNCYIKDFSLISISRQLQIQNGSSYATVITCYRISYKNVWVYYDLWLLFHYVYSSVDEGYRVQRFWIPCFYAMQMATWMEKKSSEKVHGITRVYPKVSELAAWRENREWYTSLPLDAIVSLFCETV